MVCAVASGAQQIGQVLYTEEQQQARHITQWKFHASNFTNMTLELAREGEHTSISCVIKQQLTQAC